MTQARPYTPEAIAPYPAFIRDNPVMQSAFASFMSWLWGQDDAHAAHTEATGIARLPRPKNGLEAMIDVATGVSKQYAESFAQWAIDTQWGVEGRDDQEDERHLETGR